nr:histidine kinase [uncultured Psychroserpens sp.]
MSDNLFFKNLIDSSSEGIIITNNKGEIIFSNNSALKLFFYNSKELIGKKIEILIPKSSQNEHVGLRKGYMKSPNNRPHGLGLDVYALRKDKSAFPAEISLSYFKNNGETFVVSIVSDISKRKKKEKKIQNFIIEQEGIKNAHIKSQLEVLKNQISPHYLFNCLSVLYSLIDFQPNEAKEFTKRLSETYGYVLETRNKELVSLKNEMDFIRNYIYLQKIRFGNKFKLFFDKGIDEEFTFVIPLAIQVLIENIFKHNELSELEKLKIWISREGEGILVQNTITHKRFKKDSFGVGLENLINQYRLISSKQPRISDDGKIFKVWIPVFKNKI